VIGPGRPSAHAGTFYPADAARLAELVDRLLADATHRLPDLDNSRIVGAILPHAGLEYSGAVAALGWARIGGLRPDILVLAGTDHGGRASGVAVWTGGAWGNPLGEVRIDAALAERVAALGPSFHADDRAHLGEHSLEVQLPFIARACPRARIVPLLVSPGYPAAPQAGGARLGSLLAEIRAAGEMVLLVASSDFAHYPSDAVAREVNRFMLEPILRLDEAELGRREAEIARRGTAGLVCGMCGVDPVRLTLAAARRMGATRGTVLGEATSAEAEPRDTHRAVGYAAVVLHS
jgi:AmmeMemoRadiSam system protein B